MSQVRTKPLRFRCQVGHAYSAEALARSNSDTVTEALGIALRIVEERAVLSQKIAHDARSSDCNHSAAGFEIKAKELRHYADILRKAALGP